MKQLLLSILFINILYNALSQTAGNYKSELATYFNFNPFEERDSIIQKLVNDKDLAIDTLILPTKKSRLYLRGYYKKFNPFSTGIKKVELLVFESDALIDGKKSNPQLVCLIIGIKDSTTIGKKFLLDIEDSIHHNLKNYFGWVRFKESAVNAKYYGYVHTYYRGSYPQASSGVGIWYRDLKSYCVSLRIDLEFINKIDSLENSK